MLQYFQIHGNEAQVLLFLLDFSEVSKDFDIMKFRMRFEIDSQYLRKGYLVIKLANSQEGEREYI